ncbi:MAG TPA: hypothetical protein DGG94_09440 [Micromonosporaceae bacterium]|nr:hypothetical protein [Micromonosporaceae bacterium]HCU50006.1 hypothetical protein [Micromonosporaceae bacterium]
MSARWKAIGALGLVVSIVVCACSPLNQQAPPERLAVVARTSVAASPTPSPTPTTKAGDLTLARAVDFRALVNETLAAQAIALLRQDEEAFLRPANNADARNGLLRRYRNLTAMRVTGFQLSSGPLEADSGTGQWKSKVYISFCFVVANCTMDGVSEPAVWADTATGPELLALQPAAVSDDWYGDPQPWELSDLHVAVGTRVVVATTAALKNRLPELLREAEKAAQVADEFAIRGKPDLYRVYLADKNEWKTWFGVVMPRWAAGYAKEIGPSHTDVVLNNSSARSQYLADMLRHELTHASTLQGKHHWSGNWWLIEGIAELAAHPVGLGPADWKAETISYVRRSWDRKLPGEDPPDDISDSAAGARYGVAFLAVKRLNDRFGHAKVIDFFERVIEQDLPLSVVSESVFGSPWSEVEADCIGFIRAYR